MPPERDHADMYLGRGRQLHRTVKKRLEAANCLALSKRMAGGKELKQEDYSLPNSSLKLDGTAEGLKYHSEFILIAAPEQGSSHEMDAL
jgi:hypothetical protein